ncbi:ROK family protein [Georgenia muralis]|uniref:Glucokinase n=1 Tax=Georgenia muralis TaxID=154117 RepID=A0A3N4ZYW0_9MICO|nr:ROK family protein [Georgenia muralis]RPF26255.1 glucokinase [Georgenia muralis]
MERTVVGIDLGGTKTAGALVAADGTLGEVLEVRTPAAGGPVAVLDAVAGLVLELTRAGVGTTDRLGRADAVPTGGRLAVGIGTAGVVDVGRGRIVSATDVLPGWTGTAVADGVRARLAPEMGEVGVHVQNDVDAHASGEAWVGAAAGLGSVLVVAVGTGVGGSVVLGGSPLRGAHHVAGEIGHLPVPGAEGLRCTCGRLGHLEAIGAGPGLYRRYLALGGDVASPDARDVVARAAAGDEVAVRAVRDSATAVGRGTAGIVTVLDPDAVLVTGGLAGSGELWWDTMEAALRAELIDPLAGIPLLRAALGNEAAIVGAARGAWDLLAERGREHEGVTA